MTAGLKQHTEMTFFVPLPSEGTIELYQDPALRSAYLDGLSFLYSSISALTDKPVSTYVDPQEAINLSEETKERGLKHSSIAETFEQNIQTAQSYVNRGPSVFARGDRFEIEDFKKQVSSFANGLLQTYDIFRAVS